MKLINYWRRRAPSYPVHLQSGKLKPLFDYQVEWLKKTAPERARRVIEIGCGTGRILKVARELYPASRIVGVDFAPEMLRQVSGDFELFCSSAMRLPFQNKEFDLALSVEVLFHLQPGDIELALKEMKRVSKQALIFTQGYIDNPSRHCFSHDIDRLLEETGYTVLDKTTAPFGQRGYYVE